MSTLKLEAGGREQFTLVTSVALDQNPLLSLYDWDNTLVASGFGSSSGSGNYYKFETIPDSLGWYTYEWLYPINANTFTLRERFEVIHTRAIETANLYCNANDVLDLYKPLGGTKLTNEEIDVLIADVMARVDGTLAPRYTVPFATGVNSMPPLIKTITANLTMCDIIESGPGRRADLTPQWVVDRRGRYDVMLDKLAAGDMQLPLASGVTVGEDIQGADHSMEDYVPTFNMLDVEYQRIDPDRLDNEQDAL